MKFEKNWFYHFCISLAIIGMFFIVICGFSTLGDGQEYPYIAKGMLILGVFVAWITVQFLASISARFQIAEKLSINKKWVNILEAIFVLLILILAVIVRVVVINVFPMKPASDYKTYYEISILLKDGTIQKLGKGYCNYIAMFPHVMGYCYILKTAFMWFGTSVLVGQLVNIFFSVGTIFFVYKIGRKLGGRITGLLALVFSAFWTSQVLYITMLSAEYVFTFFLYGCIWLFISLMKDYNGITKKSLNAVILHLILGVLIAITSAIRPMGIILLVAIIICVLPQKMKLPNIPRNDISLPIRMLEKGWIRCILIVIPYLIVSGIITTNIELEIDRTLPSSSTSFGYNLLVGLNTNSIGGWNEDDAKLLYDSMEATGSATQAHITCRDLAFIRLTNNPKGIFNLFINKYELLWGNDDYGATWNITFLDEQGNLTDEKSNFLYEIRDYNDIFYMIIVFFAIIALIYLWKKEGSFAYVLVLIYLGTVAIHLFVESQNRYHYFVLQVFMILAAMGVQFIFQDEREKRKRIILEKENNKIIQKQEQYIVEQYDEIEEKAIELKAKAMVNTFDMDYALKNGHVIMTVTEAYGKEEVEKK